MCTDENKTGLKNASRQNKNVKVSHQQHLDYIRTNNYKIIVGTIWVEKNSMKYYLLVLVLAPLVHCRGATIVFPQVSIQLI